MRERIRKGKLVVGQDAKSGRRSKRASGNRRESEIRGPKKEMFGAPEPPHERTRSCNRRTRLELWGEEKGRRAAAKGPKTVGTISVEGKRQGKVLISTGEISKKKKGPLGGVTNRQEKTDGYEKRRGGKKKLQRKLGSNLGEEEEPPKGNGFHCSLGGKRGSTN